jgi:hypothetical protein
MLFGLIVIVVVAAVVVLVVRGQQKSADASFISFPCRTCGTAQNISVAETMRRVREAHGKGALGELSKHEILCGKCGASQTADWLMNPRTKKLINDLDATVYRDATANEYMNIVSADTPGAPALNSAPIAAAPIIPAAPAPVAATPSLSDAPPPLPASPDAPAPKPGEPQRSG